MTELSWAEFYVARVDLGRVGYGPSCPAPVQGTHLNDSARRLFFLFSIFIHSAQIIIIYDRLSIKKIDR